MRLDPEKSDCSKLISFLASLSALSKVKADRDWAAETIKTLKAGKLETHDLPEFVAHAYETELRHVQDHAQVWEYSQALLALIDELNHHRIRTTRTDEIRSYLHSWKKPE